MTRLARHAVPYWGRSGTTDTALSIAYAISEWAIAFVGPCLWVFLGAGFLASVLGNQ